MQLTQQWNFNIIFPVTSGVIFCHYQYGLDWDMKADALTLWMTIYYLKDTVVVSKEQREASQQVSCHVINYRPVTLMTKERQGAGTMRTFILSSSGKGAPVSPRTPSSAASRLPDFCSPWQWMWSWECDLSIILSFLKGTLTMVNDCNKTKQYIPNPKLFYSVSLKMGSIETIKGLKDFTRKASIL